VALEDHFLNCVSNNGTNDLGSGLLYHDGVVVPMEIIPRKDGSSSPLAENQNKRIPEVNFGVEVELSCASGNYQERTALSIAKHAGIDVRTRRPSGKGGRKGGGSGSRKGGGKGRKDAYGGTDKWKLIYDSSLESNPQNPHSCLFELVSPILSGSNGLGILSNTVTVMADVACVRVNSSMGCHVHVEAKEENYSLDGMKSICQQFLLFEDAIDSFLPHHRRTGAEKCHSYFESNAISAMCRHKTLEGSVKAISACGTRTELYYIMNPGQRDRYHKLNLQNLNTGRQPTIEFRQHHATKDVDEILAWVRFCILFVVNAAKRPLLMSDSMVKDEDATFDELFADIIRCPDLHAYYASKRIKLGSP